MSIPGAIRFNTDSMKLEYYRGGPVGFGTTTQTGEWVNLTTDSPDIQTGGARGVFGGGGSAPTVSNVIDYITISSTGNATDFGDLTDDRNFLGSCASATRGLWGGGYAPGRVNIIDYITISSTGNALDFGDLTQIRWGVYACSSSTRGVFATGSTTNSEGTATNTVDYVTMASTGNAVDFGDLTRAEQYVPGCSSPTRGLFGGGGSNTIDFITIATTGNALDFGDLNRAMRLGSACANPIRGLFGGGNSFPGSTATNIIDFVMIASIGNALDFGDLSQSRNQLSACSSSIRGVFGGGYNSPTIYNTIDYVTIASTGNASDFGDLTTRSYYSGLSACSNGHGGLG